MRWRLRLPSWSCHDLWQLQDENQGLEGWKSLLYFTSLNWANWDWTNSTPDSVWPAAGIRECWDGCLLWAVQGEPQRGLLRLCRHPPPTRTTPSHYCCYWWPFPCTGIIFIFSSEDSLWGRGVLYYSYIYYHLGLQRSCGRHMPSKQLLQAPLEVCQRTMMLRDSFLLVFDICFNS